MFEFEAYEVLKTKEFTVVNDCFQNEYNEKIGHYGQTLFSVWNIKLDDKLGCRKKFIKSLGKNSCFLTNLFLYL